MVKYVVSVNYKGYFADIFENRECYYGQIDDISDLVTFEGFTVFQAEVEFEKAVDRYLKFCERVGKEPDKPRKDYWNYRRDII